MENTAQHGGPAVAQPQQAPPEAQGPHITAYYGQPRPAQVPAGPPAQVEMQQFSQAPPPPPELNPNYMPPPPPTPAGGPQPTPPQFQTPPGVLRPKEQPTQTVPNMPPQVGPQRPNAHANPSQPPPPPVFQVPLANPAPNTAFKTVPVYNNMWLRKRGTNMVVPYNQNLANNVHKFELLPNNQCRDRIIKAQKIDAEYRRAYRLAELNANASISNMNANPAQIQELDSAYQQAMNQNAPFTQTPQSNQVVQQQAPPEQPYPDAAKQPIRVPNQENITKIDPYGNAQEVKLNAGADKVPNVNVMKKEALKAELVEKHGFNPGEMAYGELKKNVSSFRQFGKPVAMVESSQPSDPKPQPVHYSEDPAIQAEL